MEVCIICKDNQPSEMNVVREKGLNTLIEISLKNNEHDIHRRLKEMKEEGSKVSIHHDCRRRFTDLRKKNNAKTEGPEAKRMRSSTNFTPFEWKRCCFLCGETIFHL